MSNAFSYSYDLPSRIYFDHGMVSFIYEGKRFLNIEGEQV